MEAEVWIRDRWLPRRYGQLFTKKKLMLRPGGEFEFDGVSDDGRIAVAISTNGGITTGGKKASSKMHKLRSDALFLLMANAQERVIVIADKRMFDICSQEKKRGRLPTEIEIERAELPPEMQTRLLAAQRTASDEMSTVRVVGEGGPSAPSQARTPR